MNSPEQTDDEMITVGMPPPIETLLGLILKPPRFRSTVADRCEPCLVCGYPISQRHHLLPVAMYGETGSVVHLCANCHELLHIIEGAKADRARPMALITVYLNHFGTDDERFQKLYALLDDSLAMEDEIWSRQPAATPDAIRNNQP